MIFCPRNIVCEPQRMKKCKLLNRSRVAC